MKLLADFHVHSKDSRFFHGKNSIEELVFAANEMGLKEIAITDHGFKHLCGTSKSKIRKARAFIDDINTWSKTKVLLGVEADIISEDGTIDIDTETITMLDVLLVSYHRLIKTDFAGFFGNTKKTKEAIQKVTNAYVNAIKRYPVAIVAHLNHIVPVDLYQVGKACHENGVMVEINNRHTKWTQEQVDELIASECLFVVSSDAHSREAVGEVENAFEIIKKYNIPSELVANVEFEESEKSETDKSIEAYMSFYEKQREESLRLQEEYEEKQMVEFTETLSPEMENALREIAEEKGIKYVNKSNPQPEVEDIDDMIDKEFHLIREAHDFMEKRSIQEFDNQNEKLDEFEKPEPVEEVEQPAPAPAKPNIVEVSPEESLKNIFSVNAAASTSKKTAPAQNKPAVQKRANKKGGFLTDGAGFAGIIDEIEVKDE